MALISTSFLLLLLLLISALPTTTVSLSSEGRALLSLTTALDLPTSILSSWNSSHPTPCRWTGISCDHLGRVTSLSLSILNISGHLPDLLPFPHLRHLDLSSNSLTGVLPTYLCSLQDLSFLSLFSNQLSGPLPSCLFRLPNLETLYLNNNNLTGTIPSSVGSMQEGRILWLNDNSLSGPVPNSITNLSSLVELYLSNNMLIGSLPEELGRLSWLEYFDISGNGLVGTIPASLGRCGKLRDLILSHNRLEGEIPSELGNCTGMYALAVLDNHLSGSIPASFGSFWNINILYLNENNLSGVIPPEIGNCTSLTALQLHMNQLEGPIPRELGNAWNLHTLTLFSNRLHGEVPIEIWRLGSLQKVLIYDNNLSGELPVEIADLVMLRNISLFRNNFSGPIPQNFGMKANLEQVDFTNNSFVGQIPDGICHMKHLRILNLGLNLLNGSVPHSIRNCSSLERLILSQNNLTDNLPEFPEDCSLLYVDLSANHIGGRIPLSLGNCKNLTTLKISKNEIIGQIPEEVGNLVNLQLLNLSSNELHGELPTNLSHCYLLSMLDLSNNRLNGSIQSGIPNLTQLTHLILHDNFLCGEIPNFLPNFAKLLELQLGGNMFNGSIPASLGSIDSLSISLNLSNNKLSGKVPLELGNLNMLQILDLSLNDLSGDLLPLGRLVSLLKFNISYNHFTGPIPSSWLKFINITPSSFLGNPGLCIPCEVGNLNCVAGGNIESCTVLRSKGRLQKFQLFLIVMGSVILCMLAVIVCSCVRYRKRNLEASPISPEEPSILMKKVVAATEDLDDKYVVGKGAHGTVYKAAVSQQCVYAVKKLKFSEQKGYKKRMVREVEMLVKVRHRNLVKPVDFWMRREVGLLVLKYMPNGSLHEVLHERKPPVELKWNTRYKIALGTAQGLAYLHHDCNPSILHRDIKPRNILLDIDMEPCISDFGIAKLVQHSSDSAESTTVFGTLGYMPPEAAFSTLASKESDVYSYGVVVLELLTRREALEPSYPENVGIVSWVNSILDNANDDDVLGKVLDSDLLDEIRTGSPKLDEVKYVLKLALMCTAIEPRSRPSMMDVVKVLIDIKFRSSQANNSTVVSG